MPTQEKKGEAVSTGTPVGTQAATAAGGKDASALIAAIEAQDAPEVAADPKESQAIVVSQLSQDVLNAMTQELKDALHQIEKGFGVLSAPRDIFTMDQEFYVIDAITIPDYEDRKKGEIFVKHIFTLEFAGGVTRNVMQSDARPRRVLARAFMLANQLGGKLVIGPYKYEKKPIAGQPEAALIFVQQPGFTQRAF